MAGLNENLGQTFLIVTHDPLVSDRTRRTIRHKDGRIESDTR
jgi:ABC-type lipoprotein export system ATPase subunit